MFVLALDLKTTLYPHLKLENNSLTTSVSSLLFLNHSVAGSLVAISALLKFRDFVKDI